MKTKLIFFLMLAVLIGGIIYLSFKPKTKPVAPYTQVTGTPELPESAQIDMTAPTGKAAPAASTPDAPRATANPAGTTAVSPTPAPGTQKVTLPDMSLGTKESKMTASKWEMTPSITAKVQQLVRLEITSTDADYAFALKDLNVNAAVTPGKTLILELVADRAGTFPFECTNKCEGHTGLNASLVVQK